MGTLCFPPFRKNVILVITFECTSCARVSHKSGDNECPAGKMELFSRHWKKGENISSGIRTKL